MNDFLCDRIDIFVYKKSFVIFTIYLKFIKVNKMALCFSLFLHTNNDFTKDKELTEYFKKVASITVFDEVYPLTVCEIGNGIDILVQGLPHTGVSRDTENLFSEVGHVLFTLLKNAPSFNFALIGIEVDPETTMTDIIDGIHSYVEFGISGIVFTTEIYEKIREKGFVDSLSKKPVNFRDGYLWLPYEGETAYI